MKKYFILIIMVGFLSNLFSQKRHYKELMNDPNISYFDTKKAFTDDRKVREKIIRKAERRARWGLISEQKAEAIEEQVEEEEVHFFRYEKFMKKSMDKDGFYDHSNTIKEYDKFIASQEKSNLRIAAGPKWNNIGPLDMVSNNDNILRNRGIGRIGVIEFHPTNPNIIYAGSAGYSGGFPSIGVTTVAGGGGLWKSIDAGKTWLPMIDSQKNLNVMDISIDPTNPETVYAIWADGIGIWKSADGGKNWSNIIVPNNTNPFVSQSQTRMFTEIIVDPKNSQHLILSSGNGVFSTFDGGTTWAKATVTVTSDTNFFGIFDLEIKPGDGNIVYATNHQAFLYKSVDGGKTFTKNTTLTQFAAGSSWRYTKIAVSASVPSLVFIAGGNEFDNRFMGIVRSDNEGTTFSVIKAYGSTLGTGSDEGLRSFTRNFAFAVSPTDANLMTVGGVFLNGSTDGGKTFKFIGKNIHVDIAEAKYQPGNARLLIGCDGGLFEIKQNGAEYDALNLNTGMATTQIDHIDVSPHKPNTFVIGTQDNGTIKYEDGKWELISGGDGSQSRFDPIDPKLIWTNFIFGPLALFKYVGINPTLVYPPIRANYQTNNIFNGILFDFEQNTNNMYVAVTNKLSRTNNSGQTWETLSTLPDDPKYATSTHYNERFVDFAIAPSNPLVIYAITEKGFGQNDPTAETKLMRSDDGGKTWNAGTKASFNNLTIHPKDPKTLWVTFLNFVWKSVDGGEKWTNVSGNIPLIPKFAMKYHEGTNDGIYIGTAIGVYYKDNTMADWVLWGEGLPGTLVTDIEIDYGRNKVIAGTYGRGLWEADLAIKNGSITSIDNIVEAKCSGNTFPVSFSTVGRNITSANTYKVELSDNKGDFSKSVSIGEGTFSPINVTLPNNSNGNGYKIRILMNNEASGISTQFFTINEKSKAIISTLTPQIKAGNEGKITITFTGTPPFTYSGTNGISGTTSEKTIDITVKPEKDINYVLTEVKNSCGMGEVSGEAKITIKQATIQVNEIATTSICPASEITIPFILDGTAAADNKYSVQISDKQGANFVDIASSFSANVLKAILPKDIAAGTGYKIRVVASSPALISEPSKSVLTIKALPTADFSTKELAIDQYKAAEIKLKLTGDGPFKVKLSDGQSFDLADANAVLKLSPDKTTEYKISEISNTCGLGKVETTVLKITVNAILANEPNTDNFEIYPNPTTGHVSLKFGETKTRKIEIVNSKGLVLFEKISKNLKESLQLQSYPVGIYFIQTKIGKQVVSKRILKIDR